MSTYLNSILAIADAIPGYSAEQLRAEIQATVKRDIAVCSVEDAAEKLSISVSTARKWIASGKLPARKIGRRVVVKIEALENLINGRN